MNLSSTLGVKPGEVFTIDGCGLQFVVGINEFETETVLYKSMTGWRTVDNKTFANIISCAPEHIIHCFNRLGDIEKKQLEALVTLGYKYMAKDKDGDLYAYESEPAKFSHSWESKEDGVTFVPRRLEIYNMASFSDNYAFDIIRALELDDEAI